MVYVNIWTHPHMSRPACLYSTTSSFQSREEREARESTQPADVDKNSRFEYWQRSVLLYIPQSCKIYCLCPLPPLKGKQKKTAGMQKVWFKLVRLLRRDLHNLFEGNGEARRELIRENVTVDSHFSGNWLDMKLSKWASRTHEESLQMMRKKDERAWKKGKKGRLDTIVTPILVS